MRRALFFGQKPTSCTGRNMENTDHSGSDRFNEPANTSSIAPTPSTAHMTPGDAPFTIEAVVSMNRGEAFVLNRAPKFIYERCGNDLIATDGIFSACYRYDRPCGRFKAFAGRKFSILLADGSFEEANGQWWDAHIEGHASISHATRAQLLKCYVFYGAMADPAGLHELRASYTGEVYPYWAYQALIRWPVDIMKYLRETDKLKRDKRHLIANCKLLAARAGGAL